MSDPLFVYGTLLPGSAPGEIAHAAARLRPIGEGSVRGRLYDLGHYPGLVLDPHAQSVFGIVFELPDDSAVLDALDEYEEFFAAMPQASQFLRIRAGVTLSTGIAVECWIYVYNRDIANARLIPSGRWGRE